MELIVLTPRLNPWGGVALVEVREREGTEIIGMRISLPHFSAVRGIMN